MCMTKFTTYFKESKTTEKENVLYLLWQAVVLYTYGIHEHIIILLKAKKKERGEGEGHSSNSIYSIVTTSITPLPSSIT